MVADLDVPVDIRAVATVREPDGLAMSSRNRYLDADQRGGRRPLEGLANAGVDGGRRRASGMPTGFDRSSAGR